LFNEIRRLELKCKNLKIDQINEVFNKLDKNYENAKKQLLSMQESL